MAGGGFEIGRQLIFEGGVKDWGKVGLAAIGGAVAGVFDILPASIIFGEGGTAIINSSKLLRLVIMGRGLITGIIGGLFNANYKQQ